MSVDEAWLRESLERAGWPLDEEAMAYLVVVRGALAVQLEALRDADLGAVAPETDLDPARAPSPLHP